MLEGRGSSLINQDLLIFLVFLRGCRSSLRAWLTA